MDYPHVGLTQTVSENQPLTRGERQAALYATMERHPTEKVGSAEFRANQERKELQRISVLYGSHMAARIVMERNIMSQGQRAIGKSHHFGLYNHMGLHEELTAQDIFNDPYERPEFNRELPHVKMAKIYGL